jgi:hypothetical protein
MIFNQVKEVVKRINNSHPNLQRFEQIQKELREKNPEGDPLPVLVLPVPTRWNSTYLVCSRSFRVLFVSPFLFLKKKIPTLVFVS